MAGRRALAIVLALLVAGGVATWLGRPDEEVTLSSVAEMWGDVLRDADQFGFRLTRMADREEMDLGRTIAGRVGARWSEDPEATRYVSAVGQALAPHVRRRGIQYEFHVVRSPSINAFAIPGGQVFVFTGMLDFLHSEAELAAILGHEMAHVDLRHCVERYQYQAALGKVGLREVGQLAELTRRVLAAGYTKYQEVEADAQGVRVSVEGGYAPEAGAEVFERLAARFGRPRPPRATTPVGEVAQAAGEAMGSYLWSHPPSDTRAHRLEVIVAGYRRQLAGRTVYVGVENYRQRIPRSEREFPEERRGGG